MRPSTFFWYHITTLHLIKQNTETTFGNGHSTTHATNGGIAYTHFAITSGYAHKWGSQGLLCPTSLNTLGIK